MGIETSVSVGVDSDGLIRLDRDWSNEKRSGNARVDLDSFLERIGGLEMFAPDAVVAVGLAVFEDRFDPFAFETVYSWNRTEEGDGGLVLACPAEVVGFEMFPWVVVGREEREWCWGIRKVGGSDDVRSGTVRVGPQGYELLEESLIYQARGGNSWKLWVEEDGRRLEVGFRVGLDEGGKIW